MASTCKLGTELSKSSYGNVYYIAGTNYVTKVYRKGDIYESTEITSTSEIDILFRLRSPYLIEGQAIVPKEDCKDATGFAVRMDHSTGQGRTIAKALSYVIIKRVLLHYALGLRCLHRENYLHLDVGTNNCLYSGSRDNPVGKLIDFGLAAAIQRDEKGQVIPLDTRQTRVTLTYRPAENFTNNVYTDRSDIWSLGMTYLELLSQIDLWDMFLRMTVYSGSDPKDVIEAKVKGTITLFTNPQLMRNNIAALLGPVPTNEHQNVTDLLLHMLDTNPATRWNIEQVIDSAYFADIKAEVKRSTGDVCREVQIAPSQSQVPFGPNHLHGLTTLIDLIQTEWPDFPLEFAFSALDIYMRVVAGVGPLTTIHEFDDLATMAALIAHRLFRVYGEFPIRFKNNKLSAWQYEGAILKQLGGIIRRRYLYDICESLEELGYAYTEIFGSDDLDTLNSYLRIDLSGYMAAVRKEVKGNTAKTQTVKVFFERLPSAESEQKSIEDYLTARDTAYTGLIYTLATYYAGAPVSMFMEAIDIFIRQLPHEETDLNNYATAAIFASYIRTYGEEPKSPYSRVEVPQVYEIVDQLTKTLYQNPFYAAASSIDELTAFYESWLLPQENGHYIIFENYVTLNPEAVMGEFREDITPTGPKTLTIGDMFGVMASTV